MGSVVRRRKKWVVMSVSLLVVLCSVASILLLTRDTLDGVELDDTVEVIVVESVKPWYKGLFDCIDNVISS
jgi:hypothetical protein